ncbi:MAG: TolC family protein [Gammaproteobacteria bacterium]|jgi:cobalt-zinc-cadmium efflux system outer membrane protein
MLNTLVRAAIACAMIVIGLTDVSAQPAEPKHSDIISLPEALSRTLAENASLRALGFDVPAAEGRLLQSTFRPSPEINVALQDVGGTDAFRGFHSAETTVTLAWVLERGIRERIVDASRAQVDVSSAEIEVARLDVTAETARRYIESLVFQARYANAERGVELAVDAVDAVHRRVEASRALEAELARAEAELARAELRLEDYEHELLSAYHRLSAQWGVTEPEFSAVAGNLSGVPALDPFEVLLARVEQNPDLTAFVSQSRLAEAELNLARARSRPGWTVSGGLRRIETTDDWAIVGGVTIPLRRGNQNQGRIAEARATLDQVEAAAEAARINIETELFVLYQELVHNIQLAERLETDVAPRFEAALTDMRRAFELGRSSYLEFRAVQTELLGVAYEILDAHADAYRLAIEIERLTGESLSSLPNSE